MAFRYKTFDVDKYIYDVDWEKGIVILSELPEEIFEQMVQQWSFRVKIKGLSYTCHIHMSDNVFTYLNLERKFKVK